MAKNAIFYASTGGTAAAFAKQIGAELGITEIFNMKEADPKTMAEYNTLVFVSANYGYGHLQDDFDTKVKLLHNVDFTQRNIALVGVGSQERHPDSFCSGIQSFIDKIGITGANWIGHAPAADYKFTFSRAQQGDRMIGLCLDKGDGDEKNAQRIKEWANQIKPFLNPCCEK